METNLNATRIIDGSGWHLGFRDGLYQIHMALPSGSQVEVALHGVSNESDALTILKLFWNLGKN